MKNKRNLTYLLIITLLIQMILPMTSINTYAMLNENNLESAENEVELIQVASGSAITPEVATGSAFYINRVEIKDQDGHDFKGTVKTDSKITLGYHYEIPNEEIVDTTKVHTLTIPDEIKIIEEKEFDLMHGTRAIVKVHIYKDNTITYQFYDAVNDTEFLNDREGYIEIYSEFNKEVIGNEGERDILFEIAGNASYPVNVKFEKIDEKVDISINKYGSYDTSTNEITWTIEVEPKSVPYLIPVTGAAITDIIQKGQVFVPNSTALNGVETTDNFIYDENTKTLTYTFDGAINTTANEKNVISFKTKANTDAFISEDQWVQFNNKAQISYTDITGESKTEDSKEATVGTTVNFIDKSGSYLAQDQVINWTVSINKNNLTIKNAKLIDKIPKGLTLDESSIKIVNKSTGEAFTTGSYQYKDDIFTYEFEQDINATYDITYTTTVTDPDAFNTNKKEFKNEAQFIGEGVPDNAKAGFLVGIATNIISKKGVKYDPKTHIISWEIVVNSNKIAINNAMISDDIPSGLKYVDGSLVVTKDGREVNLNGLTYTDLPDDAKKTGNFTYKFGDISDTYVVTFKTEVLDNNAYATNGTKYYENIVYLTGKHPTTGNNIGDEAKGTQQVTSEVIKKEAAGYDHITRETSWKIIVNKNEMLMDNSYVEDVIGKYEELVDGSVMINGMKATLGGNADVKGTYYYDKATKKLTYNFPSQITEIQTITFKTKIVDLSIFKTNADQSLTNTAVLYGDDIPNDVHSTASQKINNILVGKEGFYVNSKDYIDWEVNINQNNIKITAPILEDILQNGLELDAATVKLVKVDTAADGKFVEKEDVTKTLLDVSYDMKTRKVIFKFTGDIESAYRLTFRTDIEPAYNTATFNNSISLKGLDSTQIGHASAITVSFQNSSGGASGSGRGSIAIYKLDDSDKKPLSGAIFELLDLYNNPIKVSNATDTDGKALFTGLKYGNVYTIREKVAPTGYVLSDKPYRFTVEDKDNAKNISYNFVNEIIKGNIRFEKVDEKQQSLKGAAFTLYAASDQNFITPIATAISDVDGIVEFKNVAYGIYKIKETLAPEGYQLSEQIITATIGEGDNGKTVTANPSSVSNKKIVTPTPKPTEIPTPGPTDIPTPEPTDKPTPEPTDKPTPGPTEAPTPGPTETPTPSPTDKPTPEPTEIPTPGPTETPTPGPTDTPIPSPTETPDPGPTNTPTPSPTKTPDLGTTNTPTPGPTKAPELEPTKTPTPSPTEAPVAELTITPTPKGRIKEKTPKNSPKNGKVEVPEGGNPTVNESPVNGKITVDEDGNWTYTPDKNFVGKDKFTITITDEDGQREDIIIEIDVGDVPKGNAIVDKELPKTGETSPWIFYIVGGFMVLMGISGFVLGKKKIKARN